LVAASLTMFGRDAMHGLVLSKHCLQTTSHSFGSMVAMCGGAKIKKEWMVVLLAMRLFLMMFSVVPKRC